MAGDWIKIRCDLAEEPEVIGMACALRVDAALILGHLVRVWSWANKHTTDGNAPIVTEFWLDDYARLPGFAKAMVSVGWLQVTDKGLLFPKFEVHNGKTAKQRALTARRVATSKQKNGNAKVTLGALPREEKRRVLGEVSPNNPSTADKPPPKKRKPKKPPKPRKRNELFDAIAEVCQADPGASGSHIGKAASSLQKADPPYTPAEVRLLREILVARGFTVPFSPTTVEKYIGWTRKEVVNGRPGEGVGGVSRVRPPDGKYDRVGTVARADEATPTGGGGGQASAGDCPLFGDDSAAPPGRGPPAGGG